MKYLKKFEIFDFDQTFPVTTVDALASYYSCDECDNIWVVVNENPTECKFCKSHEIEELSEHEYDEVVGSRLHGDDLDKYEKEKKSFRGQAVNLNDLKNDNDNYVN